jgi:hypothetical protein
MSNQLDDTEQQVSESVERLFHTMHKKTRVVINHVVFLWFVFGRTVFLLERAAVFYGHFVGLIRDSLLFS